ncbi:MAG: hypothetical protein AB7O96_14920 [Pseudobdellovibrionaceae bacterium]
METNLSNGKEIAQDLKNAGRKAYDRAVEKAHVVGSNIESRSSELAEDLTKTAEAYFDTAQQTVSGAVKTTLGYAQKHPVQTALGAAAIGFVVGIAMSRRH